MKIIIALLLVLSVFTVINNVSAELSIKIIEPNGSSEDNGSKRYEITWAHGDTKNNAVINLFYTVSTNSGSPLPVIGAQGISLAEKTNKFIWNTSLIADNNYYILGEIRTNGILVCHDFSDGYVTIGHGEPDIDIKKGVIFNVEPIAINSFNWIKAGDLNRDGFNDLAIANSINERINIFLQNGTGSFQKPNTYVEFESGYYPSHIAMGDVDNDGTNELVTCNSSDTELKIIAWRNGGFVIERVNNSLTMNVYKIETGDFNSDGRLDIAAAHYDDSQISIMTQGPDGILYLDASLNTGNSPYGLAAGDINNDGLDDIAVIDELTSDNIQIFTQSKTGSLVFSADYSYASFFPSDVAVGDVNNDGLKDVVVVGDKINKQLDVFLQQNRVLVKNASYSNTLGSGYFQGVSIGDVNGDGRNDIAVSANNNNAIGVFWQNTNNKFDAMRSYAAGGSPYGITVSDLDGDDQKDISVINYSAGNMYLYRASISPTIEIVDPSGSTNDITLGRYVLTWNDSDPDDDARISLYYSSDTNYDTLLADGHLIVSNISEDDPDDTYVWNTKNVTPGEYYIFGVIDDGRKYKIYDFNGPIIVIGKNPLKLAFRRPGRAMKDNLSWSNYNYNYPYAIRWFDDDEGILPDSRISIYGDSDWQGYDGTPFTNNIPQDLASNIYYLRPGYSAGKPVEAAYYIYGIMTNSQHGVPFVTNCYAPSNSSPSMHKPVIFTPGAVIFNITTSVSNISREIDINFSMCDIMQRTYGVQVFYMGREMASFRPATIRHPVTHEPYQGIIEGYSLANPNHQLGGTLTWISHLDLDEGGQKANNYMIQMIAYTNDQFCGNLSWLKIYPFNVDNSLIISTTNKEKTSFIAQYNNEDGVTSLSIPKYTFPRNKVRYITIQRLVADNNISPTEAAKIEAANAYLKEIDAVEVFDPLLDRTLRKFSADNIMGQAGHSDLNGNTVQIRIPYPANFHVVDESLVWLCRLNEENNRWEKIENAVINKHDHYITASVDQLGIYKVFSLTRITDLSQFIAFPNPYRPKSSDTREDYLKIDRLPVNTHLKIEIYTISGELVRILDKPGEELEDNTLKIKAYWDGKNDHNKDVQTGIYFYLIRCDLGTRSGKIALIRE